jgi:hypothetical protein
MKSIQRSIRSVSKLRKFSRPPPSKEPDSREKYTSFARDPPICIMNQQRFGRMHELHTSTAI